LSGSVFMNSGAPAMRPGRAAARIRQLPPVREAPPDTERRRISARSAPAVMGPDREPELSGKAAASEGFVDMRLDEVNRALPKTRKYDFYSIRYID
jgi:hypothetical protein